ncbi:MAG: hypothetical protein RJA49_394, partial [Actinomycetota bacterium]
APRRGRFGEGASGDLGGMSTRFPTTDERSADGPSPVVPATRAGMLAMLPLIAGYLPFALVVGAAVAEHGTPWAGWAGSWLIYGGSAHLATVRTLDKAGHAAPARLALTFPPPSRPIRKGEGCGKDGAPWWTSTGHAGRKSPRRKPLMYHPHFPTAVALTERSSQLRDAEQLSRVLNGQSLPRRRRSRRHRP